MFKYIESTEPANPILFLNKFFTDNVSDNLKNTHLK